MCYFYYILMAFTCSSLVCTVQMKKAFFFYISTKDNIKNTKKS